MEKGRAAALFTAVLLAIIGAVPAAHARPAEKAPKAPEQFVALSDVDGSILQDIRYATPHNFVGRPVDGYLVPMCVLTRPAARALHRVQQNLIHRGYSLKVYDCYRPQRAVNEFATWADNPNDRSMKREFYPDVDKSQLFADGYIATRSGHSRGSTVDLTIVKLPASPTRPYRPGEPLVPCYSPKAQRFPDSSIDMGTGFDCFDPRAHTLDPRVQGVQRADRLLLEHTLEGAGFTGIPEEWWHFTYKAEPFPSTYFDFPVSRASLARPAPHP